jgi:tetratricopeptide (TPR) repeat protein
MVFIKLGELSAAKATLEQAESVYKKLAPNSIEHATVLLGLGIVLRELGELSAATAIFEQGQSLLPQTSSGHVRLLSSMLFNLSMLLIVMNKPNDALALLNEAWEIIKNHANNRDKAVYAQGLGMIYLALNKPDEAKIKLDESIHLQATLEHSDKPLMVITQMYQGELLRQQGNLSEAKQKLKEALHTATEHYGDKRPPIFGQIYLILASVNRDAQNYGIARTKAQLALDVFNQYPFDADHPLLVEALRLVSPQTALTPQVSTLAGPSSGASSSSSQASAVTRLSSGASSSSSQSGVIASAGSNSHSFGSSTGPACFSPPSSSSSSAPVAPVRSTTPTTVDPEAAARILASFTPIAPKQ